YGFYRSSFARQFPDAATFADARCVLEAVVAGREPLSEKLLGSAAGLDEEALHRVLRDLSAYLTERQGRYAFYHQSLADLLTEPARRGTLYHVGERQGHRRLADALWREYEAGPTEMSAYASLYLPAHLLATESWGHLEALLMNLDYLARALAEGRLLDLVRLW